MKFIDIEYVGENGFEILIITKGSGAKKRYEKADEIIGKYDGKLNLRDPEVIETEKSCMINIKGTYKDKRDLEELRKELMSI